MANNVRDSVNGRPLADALNMHLSWQNRVLSHGGVAQRFGVVGMLKGLSVTDNFGATLPWASLTIRPLRFYDMLVSHYMQVRYGRGVYASGQCFVTIAVLLSLMVGQKPLARCVSRFIKQFRPMVRCVPPVIRGKLVAMLIAW